MLEHLHRASLDFSPIIRGLILRADDQLICVVEERALRRIVATGGVFVERKFLRGCGKAGHIEDVVVDERMRGGGQGVL
ncbi:hypothetical protein Sjap_001154 [Stephania japonica]|uniref:Glucosamine 6-phosphate N-acetyltransferase n=1 Tax=Stephania japonica TaxID=461633 RepID=A0AAP0KLP6_9MAGN